jgi:uncharacterized damage-inducible protein DinB
MHARPFVSAAVLVACLVAVPAFAQAPAAAQANPITASIAGQLGLIKGNLLKSAEQVPENLYGFKPTADVRSFGQLFAHVADANTMICSIIAGDKGPAASIEKTKTTKADISAALAESFAYCEKVAGALTDADGAAMVNLFGMKMAKTAALGFNVAHDFEHYGNVVTYMRLNKMVPPSSQGRGM